MPARMRILLSYGHDEHAAFAERLKKDLQSRRHEVWFDLDRLRPGGDWEAYIEEGLEWVGGSAGAGRVILLMTPHSVRRPDGYCLNEVARALARRYTVIPVMVVSCEPPLSLCRIQWLDMQDCVPIQDRADRYEVKFARLLDALEQDRLDFQGGQARLLRVFEPLPFEGDIAHHLPRFTGRKWVFDRLDAWLNDSNASRVFWIVGLPGVGKTALAAWLCYHRPEVAAFHLCRHGHMQKADPRRCVLSLAYQLSSQLPGYQTRLQGLNLESETSQTNAKTLFDALVVQPLSANFPRPPRTLVVLIDGLDEATHGGKNELASFIGSEFDKTPDWLRLVLTSRPDTEVEHPLQRFTPYVLDASAPENERDLRDYISREFKTFDRGVELPQLLVSAILSRSEGVFLYVEWVRQELAEKRLSLDRLAEFPQGLGGVYAQYFARQFPDLPGYEEKIRPVMEAITAAAEPLEIKMLDRMFGWNDYARQHFQRAVGSLFPFAGDHVQPFHLSITDWLTDPSRAGLYYVSRQQGHQRLLDYRLRGASAGPDETAAAYFLKYLPYHLAEVGSTRELVALARDSEFLRKQETTFPDTPNLALLTLELALRAAENEDNAAWMAEFLLALATRSSQTRQQSPLEALREGNANRAQRLIELVPGTNGLLWGLLIASELQEHGQSPRAHAVMQSLLQRDLNPLNTTTWEAAYAADLLADLPDVDRPAFDALTKQLFPEGYGGLCDSLVASDKKHVAMEVARSRGPEGVYHGLVRKQAEELLAAGAFSEAWALLNQLPGYDQMSLGKKIVLAQIQADQEAEVLQRVKGWKPWNRALVLVEIAQVRSQQGASVKTADLFAAALQAATEVQEERGRLLGLIAAAQAQAGDQSGSQATFLAALEAARQGTDLARRNHDLQSIAKLLAESEDFATAQELAREISDPSSPAYVWGDIARAFAKSGRLAEALALAGGAEPRIQPWVFQAIGLVQIQNGDLEGAEATARKLEGWVCDQLLQELANQQAQHGDLARALETARSIRTPRNRGNALWNVALHQARTGQLMAALEVAEGIVDYDAQAGAFFAIAAEQAKLGNFPAACDTAKRIRGSSLFGNHSFEMAQRMIAAYHWQAGRHDEYRTLYAAVLDSHRREASQAIQPALLRDLAVGRAKAGAWSEGVQIAQGIPDKSMKSEALKSVAVTMIEAGNWTGALELTPTIPERQARSKVLCAVARAQAEAGMPDIALKTSSVANIIDQVEVLQVIVPALATAGQKDRARRVLAHIEGWIRNADTQDKAERTGLLMVQSIVFTALGTMQAQLGETGSARALFHLAGECACQIEEEDNRLFVQQRLAQAELEAGERDLVCRTVEAAWAMAKEASAMTAFGLHPLFEILGKAGCVDQARQLLNNMSETGHPLGPEVYVVRGIVASGDLRSALEFARTIHGQARGTALREIAKAQAEKSLFADAFTTAELLRIPGGHDPRDYDWARADIAEAQANAGLLDQALATLASIKSPYHQACVLARIAVAHSRCADKNAAVATLAEAREKAQTPESGTGAAGGHKYIVDAQLEIGDCDGARETAFLISEEWERVNKLVDITVALIGQGRLDKAIEIVKTLGYVAAPGDSKGPMESRPSPLKKPTPLREDRSRYLGRLGAALAGSGHRALFKQLLRVAAESLETAQQFCLLLAEAYPEQIMAIAEVVVRARPKSEIPVEPMKLNEGLQGQADDALNLAAIADLFRALNQDARAEELYCRALGVYEAMRDSHAFGPQRIGWATILHKMGMLCHDQRRYTEAERWFRQALGIRQEVWGIDDPKLVTTLHNVADCLCCLERYPEAEQMCRRALDINEKSYGKDHPDVVNDLNQLATLLYATNRMAEAEPLLRRCLIILLDFTQRTGQEHPQLQAAIGNYAELLQELGLSSREIQRRLNELLREHGVTVPGSTPSSSKWKWWRFWGG